MLGFPLGARLALCFVICAGGCQGEYPIAPTPCDDWCKVTQGFSCGFYDPAACVFDCEEQNLTGGERCREPFEAAMACFRATPGALAAACSFAGPEGSLACSPQFTALRACSGALESE